MDLFKTDICASGVHCAACRSSESDFRRHLLSVGQIDKLDFDCPFGVPKSGSVDDRKQTPLADKSVSTVKKIITYQACANYDPAYKLERKSETQCGCLLIWCNAFGPGGCGAEIKSRLCYGANCEFFAEKE